MEIDYDARTEKCNHFTWKRVIPEGYDDCYIQIYMRTGVTNQWVKYDKCDTREEMEEMIRRLKQSCPFCVPVL